MTTWKTYSCTAHDAEMLIQRYLDVGGNAVQIAEGSLGLGDWVLYFDGDALKYAFSIQEKYVNEWSSDILVTRYHNNRLPRRLMRRVQEVLERGAIDDGRDQGEPILHGVHHIDECGRVRYGW